METDKTNKDATKYREEFKQETNLSDGFLFVHAVGFRHEYVMWLETKLYLMEVTLNRVIKDKRAFKEELAKNNEIIRCQADLSVIQMKKIDDLLKNISKNEEHDLESSKTTKGTIGETIT